MRDVRYLISYASRYPCFCVKSWKEAQTEFSDLHDALRGVGALDWMLNVGVGSPHGKEVKWKNFLACCCVLRGVVVCQL